MKFSIVIPVRNRANEIKYTLQTCLEQTFDDYEIVINDNCSTDNLQEVIESFHSDKIKYYKEEKPLAMTLNFQSAMKKAKGDYIYVMGSDDGLCLNALEILDKVTKCVAFDVISWPYASFAWKGYYDGCEQHFDIPNDTRCSMREGKREIDEYVNGKFDNFSGPPNLYCCAIASRRILDELENKGIPVFASRIPDGYSGLILAAESKYYFRLGISLSINAVSQTSNGTQQFFDDEKNKEKNLVVKDFKLLNKQIEHNYSDFFTLMEPAIFCIDEAFMAAREIYGGVFHEIQRDPKMLIKRMLNYELGVMVNEPKGYKKDFVALVLRLKSFIEESEKYKHLALWYEEEIESIYTEELTNRILQTPISHRF